MVWSRGQYRSLWVAGVILAGCGAPAERAADAPGAKDTPSVAEARRTVLMVGTSLTAGYGLDPADAYPARLQEKIDDAHLPFHVVNAGVSGETSAGARRRIGWLLSQGPVSVVVIETGANDGLRGLPVDSLRANLDAILGAIDTLAPRPAVVVVGMEALPNLGRRYVDAFRAVYPAVARAHGAVAAPFLLDGVAGVESLNQADGIHPNPQGARRVADNLWRTLRPILDSIAAR